MNINNKKGFMCYSVIHLFSVFKHLNLDVIEYHKKPLL